MKKNDDNDPDLAEKSLRNVRDLVDQLEREQMGRHSEKRILLVLGALVVALVLAVGLAVALKGMKEKDLATLQRCEMDHQVSLVWKEMERLKKERPDLAQRDIQAMVETKRPQFKEAAKALCAAK